MERTARTERNEAHRPRVGGVTPRSWHGQNDPKFRWRDSALANWAALFEKGPLKLHGHSLPESQNPLDPRATSGWHLAYPFSADSIFGGTENSSGALSSGSRVCSAKIRRVSRPIQESHKGPAFGLESGPLSWVQGWVNPKAKKAGWAPSEARLVLCV